MSDLYGKSVLALFPDFIVSAFIVRALRYLNCCGLSVRATLQGYQYRETRMRTNAARTIIGIVLKFDALPVLSLLMTDYGCYLNAKMWL